MNFVLHKPLNNEKAQLVLDLFSKATEG
jgi:hypothetical protein